MISAGVNCFRVNMSHGTLDDKKEYFELIKSIRDEGDGQSPAILADLAGPKIRVEVLKKPIKLEEGQLITLSNESSGDGFIPIPPSVIFGDVDSDAKVLINDGRVSLHVIKKISNNSIQCKTINPGLVETKKGINFLGVALDVPSLTSQDKLDLELAVNNGADWIALSFVRSPDDFYLVKNEIEKFGFNLPIMAKIEKWEAVHYLDKIIKQFDGVMVARGDLGVELPLERVPIIQKEIITKAREFGKPVVIATQILDSMIERPTPTRAEVSDIANAIFDGADSLMVTGETAAGNYPKKVIEVLSSVIKETESSMSRNKKYLKINQKQIKKKLRKMNTANSISHAACTLAEDLGSKVIVTMTESGSTANMISKYRPNASIIAMTTVVGICRKLSIVWGVIPALVQRYETADDIPTLSKKYLNDMNYIQENDKYIITGGAPINVPGTTNYISVISND